MGGTISFESTQGVGTTFVITIPFKIDTQAASHTPEPSARQGLIRGLHILLVEDNELNMEIAEFLIQNEGCHGHEGVGRPAGRHPLCKKCARRI